MRRHHPAEHVQRERASQAARQRRAETIPEHGFHAALCSSCVGCAQDSLEHASS
jgi:hypothetical protein